MRGAWVEIVIIGTTRFERQSPLTAVSTLTKSKVCADHPFVRSAAHTHNENRTEVLCPRVTQAAMIAAASFGLRRSGTFATATSGAAYWAASVRHGPPWPLPVNAPKSIFQNSILYRVAVDLLNAQEQTAMHDALHQVLTTIAASGAHRHFGVCQDCVYLGGEMNADSTSASRSALGCLLVGVPIEPVDAGLLCVHFQPKSDHREDGHRE